MGGVIVRISEKRSLFVSYNLLWSEEMCLLLISKLLLQLWSVYKMCQCQLVRNRQHYFTLYCQPRYFELHSQLNHQCIHVSTVFQEMLIMFRWCVLSYFPDWVPLLLMPGIRDFTNFLFARLGVFVANAWFKGFHEFPVCQTGCLCC